MKNRIIIASSLIVLLIITITFSYAYLRKSTTQTGENTFSSLTCLDLSITNVDGSIPLSFSEAFAIPDSEGLKTNSYDFTVTNNCTTSVSVDINLESLSVTDPIDKSHVKVALDSISVLKPIGFILGNLPEKEATIENATSNNLTNIVLTNGESKSYSLRLWIDEATSATEGMNKNYSGKIVAVASPSLKYKPNANLKNAQTGTLLAYLRDGDYNYKAPLTIPGREISLENEAVLSATLDDYGTSYYFRGNVKNNYVVFANMCWRIVRVTGNGSIKLVLLNKNGISCTGNNSGIGNGTLGSSNGYNAYIGYMYGNPGSESYAAEHANLHNSTILNNLITWYNASFSNIQQVLLADVIWCNDKSISSGLGYGANISFYGAYGRLNPVANANPTLVCPNDTNGGDLSKFTAEENQIGNATLHNEEETEFYKIGLITADEAAFAGGVWGIANSTYYLVNRQYFKLLSPYNEHRICNVANNGLIGQASNAYDIRPSIALIPEVEVTLEGTGNPGTVNNPYVVVENAS